MGTASSKGHHPILYVSDLEVAKNEELTLLKFEDRDSKDPVTFGSSICFQTAEGHFLYFKGTGELRIERNPRYEEGQINVAKLTKWTILDARRVTSREKVTPFNDVCFKSPLGHYLQVEVKDNDIISANGVEINQQCMFKIVKSNVPHLPDWLFKRPHLNHNSITASFSMLVEP
jgi:hypothetical protein